MVDATHVTAADTSITEVQRFLGGKDVFPVDIHTGLDAHRLIRQGFPGSTVAALQNQVKMLRDPDVLHMAVGIRQHPNQRSKDPAKELSEVQSGRIWTFAVLMAKSTEVFGSQEEAERWMMSPAIGLDQQRPVGLLSTPAGVALVEELLGRMEYGVYA